MSLHQTFVHCGIFPTAASRRSLGRISVQCGGSISQPAKHHRLGGPLPHQLANVAHSDLLAKQALPFILLSCKNNKYSVLSDVSIRYPNLKGTLSTCYSPIRRYDIAIIARHACIRHTASVHPEPGSNSRKNWLSCLYISSFQRTFFNLQKGCLFIIHIIKFFEIFFLKNILSIV